MDKTDFKDYRNFESRCKVEDAVIFFGTRAEEPNYRDQVPYYLKILAEGLEAVGWPVLSVKYTPTPAMKAKGKSLIVYRWNGGETRFLISTSGAEKAVRWFEAYSMEKRGIR